MKGCSERESQITNEIGREKIEREDVRERESSCTGFEEDRN